MQKTFKIGLITTTLLMCTFFFAGKAFAATMAISPTFENKSLGQSFTAHILVNPKGESVNAISGTIVFPTDKLEVTGISKFETIINVWISEPSFSNENGEINFEGIILNPGFSGTSGKIIGINFRAKGIGLAKTFFSSASVLANDGTGTNVLTEMTGGEYNVLNSASQGITGGIFTTPSIAANSPKATKITSPTHPNPNTWYQNNTAKFAWETDNSKIIAVRTLLNREPYSAPTILTESPITERGASNLENGTWYFHLQLKNSEGWGSISHFRINIDNESPKFQSKQFIEELKSYNPKPNVNLSAYDNYSGVEKYAFKIDNGEYSNIEPENIVENNFSLPKQEPGKHIIFIKATDFAGNETIEYQEFEILGIDPPEVIAYSENIKSEENLFITGQTYPDSSVYISIEDKDGLKETFIVRSDLNGVFNFLWPKNLKSGSYKLSTKVQNQNGATSYSSQPREFKVSSNIVIQIGAVKIINPYIGYLFMLTMVIIIVGGVYGWYINFKHGYSLHKYRKRKSRE